jgi:hypothetical protein
MAGTSRGAEVFPHLAELAGGELAQGMAPVGREEWHVLGKRGWPSREGSKRERQGVAFERCALMLADPSSKWLAQMSGRG